MAQKTVYSIGGRMLALTNLGKPLWPEDGLTKADLISYYVEIAPYLLPYLKDRPLVFTRYPDGIYGNAFYQKDKPQGTPDWVRTFPIEHRDAGRVVYYVIADEPATLAWVANLACIEIHPWLSSASSLDCPDFAVFDLDPADGAQWSDVRTVAMLVKQVLESFGLTGYVKTTGASGLHIFVPIWPRWSYNEVQLSVEFAAKLIRDSYPEKVTLERIVKKRTGKVYIDYLQNIKGKTLVSIFSPRPRKGAPVSFPIRWDELGDVTPESVHLRNAVERIVSTGDAYRGALAQKQDLSPLLNAAEHALSSRTQPRSAVVYDRPQGQRQM